MNYDNFWKLIYTSTITFLFFGFVDAARSLVFAIYYDANYAYLNSAQAVCNYVLGPIALLFMEYLLRKMRYGTLLYLGGFSQTLILVGGFLVLNCSDHQSQILCEEYLIVIVTLIASSIGGPLATVFYVTYPIYINNLSNEQNRSVYYGIGYSIYFGSMIIGNVLGYYLLPIIGEFKFYLFILIISSALQLFLIFSRQSQEKQQTNAEEPIKFIQSIKDSFIKILQTLKINKFKALINFVLAYTIFESSRFQLIPYFVIQIIKDKQTQELQTFILFVGSSIGSVVGGFVAGKLIQKFQKFWTEIIWVIQLFISVALCQVSVWIQSIILLQIGSFCLGASVNGLNIVTFSIISNEISQENIVFTAHNLIQCIGFSFCSIVWLNTVGRDMLIPCQIFYSFGLFYILISLLYYRYKYTIKINIKHSDSEYLFKSQYMFDE